MTRLIPDRMRSGLVAAIAACSLFLIAGQTVHADLMFSAENVTAAPGSTGNGLDVTLTNTGSTAVDIGGFAFQITVNSSDINFTGATVDTAMAYVFAGGNSTYGPDGLPINLADLPSQTLEVGDNFLMSSVSLASGVTVGLGHVLFDVASTAIPGSVYSVSFGGDFYANNLSDGAGTPLTINALNDGSITVPSAVASPEPSSFLVAAGVIVLTGLCEGVRRIRKGRLA